MSWAIQVSFLGSQEEEFFGKAGNLRKLEPVYEGNVLVGAVITVARPLISALGTPCIPLKWYMVTYPVNAVSRIEQDSRTGVERISWNTYIPVELFKPSLERIIWAFNTHASMKVCIQGNLFGHEAYSTENQRLHDALISSQITAQFVYEQVKKVRGYMMRSAVDIWEGEIKLPMERVLKITEEMQKQRAITISRSYGRYGRKGGHDQYGILEGEEYPEVREGPLEFGEMPPKKKGVIESLMFWRKK